jgi:hypothetical protein
MTRKCGEFYRGFGVTASLVMPGLVPGIHVLLAPSKDADGRDKPGHDGDMERFVRLPSGCRGPAELRLQRDDPRLQRLVFLARQPGHVLDRLELLALDDI